MATEDTEIEQQEQEEDGGDLQDMLGTSGETEFVTEEEGQPSSSNKGLLIALLLVALGGAVYFMYFKTGPAPAAAGTVTPDESAHKTITTFLSDSGQNIKVMEEMLKNTEKVVQQFNNYPSMTQVPVSGLHINPFRFEQAVPATTEDAAAEAKRQHEKVRAEVTADAQKLQLQSVMAGGARRSCMINGSMYMEGQTVEGFLVERIAPGGIVLRKDAFRVPINMTH